MNYILFDGPHRINLLPFTFTRPVSDIRIGILTIRQKWEWYLKQKITSLTEDYLAEKYPMVKMAENIMINASYLPNADLVSSIKKLTENQALCYGDDLIAFYSKKETVSDFSNFESFYFQGYVLNITQTWHIFSKNSIAIVEDFKLITKNRTSQSIPKTINAINPQDIFIEKGAKLSFATLNASAGPIYIGNDSEVMEGSMVRGPFALCNNATLKLAAKIYGPTTIGPNSKVGGEVNNSVIFGYSNKAHDGFLGNSVLGEWCNLGADTNNSNLKNNYSEVSLWNYGTKSFTKTGLQFCGLLMGDHSKCGINTMFNTGTVVGVSANIFGCGFPRNYIPSFSWGGSKGFVTFTINKALEVAKLVVKRRNEVFSDKEEAILKHIFELTSDYRIK